MLILEADFRVAALVILFSRTGRQMHRMSTLEKAIVVLACEESRRKVGNDWKYYKESADW